MDLKKLQPAKMAGGRRVRRKKHIPLKKKEKPEPPMTKEDYKKQMAQILETLEKQKDQGINEDGK